jgi:hypothetical protein
LMNATQTKWTNSVELVAKRVEHCGEDAVPRSVVIVAYGKTSGSYAKLCLTLRRCN